VQIGADSRLWLAVLRERRCVEGRIAAGRRALAEIDDLLACAGEPDRHVALVHSVG